MSGVPLLGEILSVILVLFFFGMCVFVHELGHFLVAKWRKLHIIAFSIGFKRAWGKKINGVEYRIGWIPAGGYVDLPQIDTTDTPLDENGSPLPPAKPLDRLLTALAGPMSNVLFGLALGCVIWIWGLPQANTSPELDRVVVKSVIVDSPEYRAGLRPGDVILELNGGQINSTWSKLVEKILFATGDISLKVDRGGENLTITYRPEPNPHVSQELRRERIGFPFFEPLLPLAVEPRENSPAARAGVRKGDIVVKADGREISDISDLARIVALAGDADVNLLVRHTDGTEEVVRVQPQPNPDPAGATPMLGLVFFHDSEPTGAKGAVIGEALAGFPAAAAGLAAGDVIEKVNGTEVNSVDEYMRLAGVGALRPGVPVELEARRASDGEIAVFSLLPLPVNGRVIGVSPLEYRTYPNPLEQLFNVVRLTALSVRNIGINLGHRLKLTEQDSIVSARNLSGPIGVVVQMHRAFSYSLLTGVYMVVFISFALAIFNLLPLPVLDGGHILFAVIEMIIRRPLPKPAVKALSMTFVVLLVGLMAWVTLLDVMRFIPEREHAPTPRIATLDDPNPVPETENEAAK